MSRAIKVVVALALPLGLLVGADRVAVGVAEGALAAEIRDTEQLASEPSVDIAGFPFLTQAVGGRYDRIELTAHGLRREGLEVARFEATLRGVEISFGDAVSGDVSAVPVDRVDATAFVAYDEVERRAAPRRLEITPVGQRLRVSGLVAGVRVSVLSRVSVSARTVRITAERVESGGVGLGALGGRFDISLRIPPLPFELRITGVRVGPAAVAVSAAGEDIVLRR